MDIFMFGGEPYIIKDKIILKGMEYYQVLENKNTGAMLYLYCFPERA